MNAQGPTRSSTGARRFPARQTGKGFLWIKGKNLLKTNLMLPAIRQIVFVDPVFFAAEVEVTNQHYSSLCENVCCVSSAVTLLPYHQRSYQQHLIQWASALRYFFIALK